MLIGIIPNVKKDNIEEIISSIIDELQKNELDYIISDSFADTDQKILKLFPNEKIVVLDNLIQQSDIVISIGGDGTMLNTAYKTRKSDTPIAGVNFGKLGFLAEYDIHKIEDLIRDIKEENYNIEKRMALSAKCSDPNETKLHAINDIVIDKGPWPKMIELTIKVDGSYVTTFNADGLIIATPTGSTGYSLSTGGPIVSPKTKAIVLSPISAHTLTMRPLVISDEQKIEVIAESQNKTIQVNCDGQRVYSFNTPITFKIKKSKISLNLLHTESFDYFSILRNKLYWGLDLRQKNVERDV